VGRRISSTLAAAGGAIVLAVSAKAAAPRLRTVTVATGLHEPVAVAAPRGETARLYVAEQSGLIRIAEGGRLLPRPFLDLRKLVWDKELAGMLAFAFDPDFARTHRIVVDYVGRDEAVHVVEYDATPTAARPSSARELLRVELGQPVDPDGHFGGGLAFGPDGLLYVGVGDGLQPPAAQDPSSPLGKLIRLDAHSADPAPETIGYGLRNPWRLSFDAATGDLYVADVGASRWEEVDFVPRSAAWPLNFGWPRLEGRSAYRTSQALGPGTPVAPLLVYPHPSKGCSAVVGGGVDRGNAVPSLHGRYVFADFCRGRVYSVRAGGRDRSMRLELALPTLISSLAVVNGQVYAVAYSYGKSAVYRLAPA
jgi:glucose/arabinose dehydrogenase